MSIYYQCMVKIRQSKDIFGIEINNFFSLEALTSLSGVNSSFNRVFKISNVFLCNLSFVCCCWSKFEMIFTNIEPCNNAILLFKQSKILFKIDLLYRLMSMSSSESLFAHNKQWSNLYFYINGDAIFFPSALELTKESKNIMIQRLLYINRHAICIFS